MSLHKCTVCGWIYDSEEGDEGCEIAPGTSFDDLPDDFECPVCGVPKSKIVEIS